VRFHDKTPVSRKISTGGLALGCIVWTVERWECSPRLPLSLIPREPGSGINKYRFPFNERTWFDDVPLKITVRSARWGTIWQNDISRHSNRIGAVAGATVHIGFGGHFAFFWALHRLHMEVAFVWVGGVMTAETPWPVKISVILESDSGHWKAYCDLKRSRGLSYCEPSRPGFWRWGTSINHSGFLHIYIQSFCKCAHIFAKSQTFWSNRFDVDKFLPLFQIVRGFWIKISSLF
jgi:hypothetical protein